MQPWCSLMVTSITLLARSSHSVCRGWEGWSVDHDFAALVHTVAPLQLCLLLPQPCSHAMKVCDQHLTCSRLHSTGHHQWVALSSQGIKACAQRELTVLLSMSVISSVVESVGPGATTCRVQRIKVLRREFRPSGETTSAYMVHTTQGQVKSSNKPAGECNPWQGCLPAEPQFMFMPC